MTQNAYLAFDLGAESGRTMLATLSDGKVELSQVNRFANEPQTLPSGLHWNLLELWRHLQEGLRLGVEQARSQGLTVRSVGVDTWGVDFALLGRSGQLLGLPFAYRDSRNPPAMQRAVDMVGEKALYEATGTQLMAINTLFQLKAQRAAEPRMLEGATRLLFMPDLLHYFFCGEAVNEATIASTSQMIDPRSGTWTTGLMEKLNHLPTHFLQRVVPAGTTIGQVRAELLEALGVEVDDPIDVIAPGSHDTASAVAAVPATGDGHWAYLSSGTWSLLGVELAQPLVSDAARRAGFTNERAVGGGIRFLTNIAGLWLVQQVRADFARRGEEHDYAALTDLAQRAQPFVTLVDTTHGPFQSPGDMCAKIDAYARSTGQPAPGEAGPGGPGGPGPYIRCCLESLALTYRGTLETLEQLQGKTIPRLHIVGGGGRNRLLNQMTADALGRPVVVGPYEATALGNALTQAMGRGDVADLAELRRIVAASFDLETFEPASGHDWSGQVQRFIALPKS